MASVLYIYSGNDTVLTQLKHTFKISFLTVHRELNTVLKLKLNGHELILHGSLSYIHYLLKM